MLAELQELWNVESVKWFVAFSVHLTMLVMGGIFGKLLSGK